VTATPITPTYTPTNTRTPTPLGPTSTPTNTPTPLSGPGSFVADAGAAIDRVRAASVTGLLSPFTAGVAASVFAPVSALAAPALAAPAPARPLVRLAVRGPPRRRRVAAARAAVDRHHEHVPLHAPTRISLIDSCLPGSGLTVHQSLPAGWR
jgi:hypothetical protein